VADVVSPAKRSQMMSGIRGVNTRPEVAVRKLLFGLGYRFRLHRRELPGSPDIVMPGRKVAVFVQGCFWHRHQPCRYSTLPATRQEFWQVKLETNAARDQLAAARLKELGWRTLWVWECALRDSVTRASLPERVRSWIEGDDAFGEVGATPEHLPRNRQAVVRR
jgi:DNA mismatch endonuclease (patch repair protein)